MIQLRNMNKQKARFEGWYFKHQIAHHWSAQDCMTIDHIPYIGPYAFGMEGVYVATGFQKWGMTSSMVSAMILSDLILEKENPYLSVFTPHRMHIGLSAKQAVKDTVHSVRGLAAGFMAPPRAMVEQLPKGHGGHCRS